MADSKLYSRKTERMLLVAMLEEPRVLQRALPHLTPQLFGNEIHREIFERMLVLIGQGKTLASAKVMAYDPGLSKSASVILLAEAQDKTSKAHSFSRSDTTAALDTLEYYRKVRILYESSKRTATELGKLGKLDISGMQAEIQRDLSALNEETQTGTAITLGKDGNLTDQFIKDHMSETLGDLLPTGFRAIDSKIKGWRKSNVVLLTAMRGEGKSMLAKTLGVNHFYNKRNVFTANLEMGDWEYLVRLFSQETMYPHEMLRSGSRSREVVRKVLGAKRKMDAFGAINGCRWTLRTVANPLYNPQALHSELKYQGYDVVIIDYINLLAGGTSQDLWHQLHNAAQYLKLMAKDLKCLVYVLAQLNDEGHAKYGRATEEACDCWIHWKLDRNRPTVLFQHGKARDYEPFEFELVFDGKHSRFHDAKTNLDEDEEVARKPKRHAKAKLLEQVKNRKLVKPRKRPPMEEEPELPKPKLVEELEPDQIEPPPPIVVRQRRRHAVEEEGVEVITDWISPKQRRLKGHPSHAN